MRIADLLIGFLIGAGLTAGGLYLLWLDARQPPQPLQVFGLCLVVYGLGSIILDPEPSRKRRRHVVGRIGPGPYARPIKVTTLKAPRPTP